MQINPPFDGSAPCPACQRELRSISAWLHGACIRWPNGKAYVRFNDLRHTAVPDTLTVPHPATVELLAVARATVAACAGMEDAGATIRWTPEITAKLAMLMPRIKAALDAFEPLTKAHFHDDRHAAGAVNILSAKRGSHWAGFVEPNYAAAEYNYTVECVPEGGDILHEPCGTRLKLHEHFLRDLRRDPTFFGKVWCPTCHGNMPIEQWQHLYDATKEPPHD